jgi:hypothetical protein
MMLDLSSNHYVPVIRWKPAEVDALTNLKEEIRSRSTPLIELCPSMFIHRKKNKNGKWLEEIRPIDYLSEKLIQLGNVNGKLPFYMDLIHVRDDKAAYSCNAIWNSITNIGQSGNLAIIPVTGFYGKGIPYQNLVGTVAKKFGKGACLRLFIRDIVRPSLANDLEKMLQMLSLTPQEVDVVIDLQMIGEQSPHYKIILEKLPLINSWRSITILAGSFPKDLGYPMKAHNTYKIPRLEWLKWKREVSSNDLMVLRNARYGDYTVQHPMFSEPVPFPNVSASIRYTCDEYWVVLRGEALGKDGGLGSAQYPAEAQLLVDRPEYSGEIFSVGDKMIMQKSKDASHPGGPRQWIMVAMNHHMTFAVCQLNPELQLHLQKEEFPVLQTLKQAVQTQS